MLEDIYSRAKVELRDGRVTALRPTAMTFPELPVAAPTTLPGRPLPRERLRIADDLGAVLPHADHSLRKQARERAHQAVGRRTNA